MLELENLGEFAQLLDETPKERRQRQAINRRIEALEDLTRSLDWVDVDDLEERIDTLEEDDFEELEDRVRDIEGLESRLDEFEARLDSV